MASINLFLFAFLLLLSHASDFSNTTIFVVVSLRAASTVIFYNKCKHPVWPGIQPSAGQNLLAGGGFKLPANKAHSLQLPPLWSGRFWGRHGCTFDRSGRGHCATGDCGGSLSCNGAGGSGQCSYAGCVSDLNQMCPVGLQVRSRNGKRVVACKSACSAFNSPQYCCTGLFGNPQSCKPTAYSKIFKVACPKAYSYAYDDPTSIATCSKANYIVTFCPHHRH
ncbi:T10O22.21 [Arabidopsis thaliana]|nr:T10O22.21 [Arabidopsis thaliana]